MRLVVMGNTVLQAAKAVGLKQRQTRNWTHRFNAEGINGLRDCPRPGQPVKLPRQAVCPATGQTHGCLISFADTSAMNGYLKDFGKHIPADEHVLMVLDRAGWHRSKTLCIGQNLTLLLLPAYSPELNPVELLWWQMRDKYLSNRVFETAEQLDKNVGKAWCDVTCEPETVRSLCHFHWFKSAINN